MLYETLYAFQAAFLGKEAYNPYIRHRMLCAWVACLCVFVNLFDFTYLGRSSQVCFVGDEVVGLPSGG